jgi:CheY-like chemotaxis protein
MRILVADDDPTVRLVVSAHLEAAGHEVVAVEDGSRVLDAFVREPPDALVIDAMMTVGGWDVIQQLRKDERFARVPMVLLSARDVPDDIRRGYEAGASVVMSKSDDLSTLGGLLESLEGRGRDVGA